MKMQSRKKKRIKPKSEVIQFSINLVNKFHDFTYDMLFLKPKINVIKTEHKN